jgi:hypothetical protein
LHCSLLFLTPNCPSFPSRASVVNVQNWKSSWDLILPPRPRPTLNSTGLDTQTLELLTHYTSTVYLTIGSNKSPDLWRWQLPHIGLSYPFVMHGVLAISALHLALHQPHRADGLYAIALREEHKALPSFRAMLPTTDPRHVHAVFAFSGMVSTYILAASAYDMYVL